eukprot:GHVS01004333.1.p1 GENE.GHVS01004333.1~~GHVS01004333.1.p1  ORF type:complete len:314 (-),score=28.99 GHVS01004333.1:697-1638(-)
MAKLRIGKMKLLAAGPPLLFLALYSLSFIDLSVSPAKEKKVPQSFRRGAQEESNTSDCGSAAAEVEPSTNAQMDRNDTTNLIMVAENLSQSPLKEENMKKAKNALENSKELQERLRAFSLLNSALSSGDAAQYVNVDMFKIDLVKKSTAAVLNFLSPNVSGGTKVRVLSVDYKNDCTSFTLMCGSEKMIFKYRFPPVQLSDRNSLSRDIKNCDASSTPSFVRFAKEVLPYFLALGDRPQVINDPLKLPTRTVFDLFDVTEWSEENVCILKGEQNDTLHLVRDVVAFINYRNDGVEMVRYGFGRGEGWTFKQVQ